MIETGAWSLRGLSGRLLQLDDDELVWFQRRKSNHDVHHAIVDISR
jgi:hypothetical protein